MSYSREYHETITVRGSESKTITYPKSETGGTMKVTVNYTEHVPVDIRINVDTNPFDRSISSANRQVNLLTGSVVATEAAHIAVKVKSSQDISNSIVDGFFGLIKSEINQQLTELKPKVEALLIEMHQHQESCLAKKKQLENDFERITERYTKIFLDLDKELRNRILMLNKSAIGVHGTLTNSVHRSFTDISSGIATVYNKEGSYLQSILFATGLKNRAVSLIDSGKNYLLSEKNLSEQFKQILSPVDVETVINRQIPVLYFEAKNSSNSSEVQIITPKQIQALTNNKTKVKDSFSNSRSNWRTINPKDREQINTYLKIELENKEAESNKLSPRVVDQIMRLWEQNSNLQSNT